MRRVLHQYVLEAVHRLRRCAPLEYQLGGNEPSERGLQLIVRNVGYRAQQLVCKIAPDGRSDLRHYRTDAKRSIRAISEKFKPAGIASGDNAPSST